MPDQVARFYQGIVAASGTIIAGQVPFGSVYTVTNLLFINNNSEFVPLPLNVCLSAYINSINNANAIVASGTLVQASGFYQAENMYVLNPGDTLWAVLSSGVSGLTASVHGVIST